jgi:hypothetical protein
MKYSVGTKFHMWYDGDPERPMYGEVMRINEKTKVYYMTFIYIDRTSYSSHYSDGLLHDILYHDDREYLEIEEPIPPVRLDEELFIL